MLVSSEVAGRYMRTVAGPNVGCARYSDYLEMGGGEVIDEPYLIWDTKASNILHQQQVGTVSVTISELVCEVTKGTAAECLEQRQQKQFYSSNYTYSVRETKPLEREVLPVCLVISMQNMSFLVG